MIIGQDAELYHSPECKPELNIRARGESGSQRGSEPLNEHLAKPLPRFQRNQSGIGGNFARITNRTTRAVLISLICDQGQGISGRGLAANLPKTGKM